MKEVLVRSGARRPEWKNVSRKMRKCLLGVNEEKQGVLVQAFRYILLFTIGFVYLYPLLYMIITSFMSLDDLLDRAVNWIPSSFYTENYKKAFLVLDYSKTFFQSLFIALAPTVLQIFVCSFVGYGFAIYNFKGKRLLFGIMLFSYVIPPQITMMPTYTLMSHLKFVGSMKAFLVPAVFGEGLYSQIFILIFYYFYKQIPTSLIEAGQIDGAGHFRCYYKIVLPCVSGAFIISFLFSFVWYWNETYLSNLYLRGSVKNQLSTLMLKLNQFQTNFEQLYPSVQSQANRLNEALEMAGCVLCIFPLLILYFALQQFLVESIDQAGITGQ